MNSLAAEHANLQARAALEAERETVECNDASRCEAAAQADAWKGWCHVHAPVVADADGNGMRQLRLQRLVKDAYAKAWAGKYIKGLSLWLFSRTLQASRLGTMHLALILTHACWIRPV